MRTEIQGDHQNRKDNGGVGFHAVGVAVLIACGSDDTESNQTGEKKVVQHAAVFFVVEKEGKHSDMNLWFLLFIQVILLMYQYHGTLRRNVWELQQELLRGGAGPPSVMYRGRVQPVLLCNACIDRLHQHR